MEQGQISCLDHLRWQTPCLQMQDGRGDDEGSQGPGDESGCLHQLP